MANSFVFDPNRCTGCHACRLACSIENQLGPERSWRRIDTYNRSRVPGVPLYHLSLACNHCSEPACMYACPALAYSRDADTGALILEEHKCIGCKYCAWACPYDAPVFDDTRGVMTKCTFCSHRLRDGCKPACASLCPTGALDFADLPEAEIRQEMAGFPVTELQPRIQIARLDPARQLPTMTSAEISSPYIPGQEPGGSEISLRSEWSLVGFTTLVAGLVAAVAGHLTEAFTLPPLAFVALAAASLGLAGSHLGKPIRAYRATLNLRRSWLSREVVAVSTFLGVGGIYLWLVPRNPALGALAALLGIVALWSADQVYSVLDGSAPVYRHSASVLWTGFFFIGVFSGTAWLASVFGVGKLMLYVLRKLSFIESGKLVRPLVSAARLGVGLILPLVLWVIDPEATFALQVGCVVLGEVIDRSEFYVELESHSPRRQMALDLRRELTARRKRPSNLGLAAAD